MPYIGREPTKGEFKKVDVSAWTFDDSSTSFPIGYQVGEVNQMVVSLNGVIQEPTSDFVLADGGTNLVFVTAPETGDSCFVLTYVYLPQYHSMDWSRLIPYPYAQLSDLHLNPS
jgi:hypothetical protein